MQNVDMKIGKETEYKPDEKREVNNLLRSMCAVGWQPTILLNYSDLELVFKVLIVIAFLISNFLIAGRYATRKDNGNLGRPMGLVNLIFVIVLTFGNLSLGQGMLLVIPGLLNCVNMFLYDKEMKVNR